MKSGLGLKPPPPPLWTKSIDFKKKSLRDAAQKTNQTKFGTFQKLPRPPPLI